MDSAPAVSVFMRLFAVDWSAMYERIPPNGLSFIIQGHFLDDSSIWQTEFDFIGTSDVPAVTLAAELAGLLAVIPPAVDTAVLAGLALKTSTDRYRAVLKAVDGTVGVQDDVTYASVGTFATTGQDLPNAVAGLLQRQTGLPGRSFKGRAFWPLGESAMLDATHANRLSGTMHSTLVAICSAFMASFNPVSTLFVPALFRGTSTYALLSNIVPQYPVTWRRSRKTGVGA